MVVDDVGDHGVAAGDGVIGQEEHRLSRRWDLQGAADHALARQLIGAGPLERLTFEPHAHAVDVAGHLVGLAHERGPRRIGEPVPPRPGHHQHAEVTRLWVGHRRDVDARRRELRGSDREHITGRDGDGPETGQHVGGAGAEHRVDREPTAHSDVGAKPTRRCAEE